MSAKNIFFLRKVKKKPIDQCPVDPYLDQLTIVSLFLQTEFFSSCDYLQSGQKSKTINTATFHPCLSTKILENKRSYLTIQTMKISQLVYLSG